MGRKQIINKEIIVKAALKVFLEKGFDQASMRDIAAEIGSSVGIIYNYFKTKDEVFEAAINVFFEGYMASFGDIVEAAYRSPFEALTNFFNFFIEETMKFRKHFADRLHWTIRFAIRERTLIYVRPYLSKIVGELVFWGATPPLELESTSIMLANGVCSMILHEENLNTDRSYNRIVEAVKLIMGLEKADFMVTIPSLSKKTDVPLCLNIIEKTSELNELWMVDEHKEKLISLIANHQSVIIKAKQVIMGLLVFSKEEKEIKYFYVANNEKTMENATKLLVTAISKFNLKEKISVKMSKNTQRVREQYAIFFRRFGFKIEQRDEENNYITLTRVVPTNIRDLLND